MANSHISRNFSRLANDIEHATDEYEFFKTNETFSNTYVDTFLNKILEHEIIPDLLISALSEMHSEYDEDSRLPSDYYLRNTNGAHIQPMRLGFDGTELVSDNLLHNFIRLPIDNRKKLSPYVVTPIQRYDSVLVRNQAQDADIIFDSPKPLKEYKIASRNSLKPLSNRSSAEFSNPSERSNFSLNSKLEANSSVLNTFTEDFITKSLRSDLIPRLALDTIGSAENERKKRYSHIMDSPDRYDPNNAKELLNSAKIKLDNYNKNNDDIFSTDFLNDFEYKSRFNTRTRNANFQSKSRINDRFILAPIDSRFDNDKNKTNNIEDLFSTDFLDSFEIKTKTTSKNRLHKF